MEFVLTIRDPKTVEGTAIGVSYDAFVDDVQASPITFTESIKLVVHIYHRTCGTTPVLQTLLSPKGSRWQDGVL